MKFRPFFRLVLLALLLSFTGCGSSTITEEQAVSIVKQKHEQISKGEISIISVKRNKNDYEVKWERKNNCESGTDYVHENGRKITHDVHSIC